MIDENTSSEVVFLLGAGASVKAGVPDTLKFVTEFQASIKNGEMRRTVDKVIEILNSWLESKWTTVKLDVELLLETLTKLELKDQEPLLQFYGEGKYLLEEYSPKQSIIENLKDYIKSRAIIDSDERIQYLQPLLGFIEQYPTIDVISVNYDTCIEKFCSVYKLDYQDGFDVSWNPRVFDQGVGGIRLYKLHGSVIWYRSDRADYIKLPIMSKESAVELFTGEKAESLMIYPMQKFDYAEPLLELLMRSKDILQNCKLLIVVGYSFRDEHIRKIIFDVARKNRELVVVFIDPNANSIYQERLRYFDSNSRIASPLAGRVVSLPYKFEDVFPYLRNHYLLNLQQALALESDCLSMERQGSGNVDWLDCLQFLANAEFSDKIIWLLENKINKSQIRYYWKFNIELLTKLSLNLATNWRTMEASSYIADLKKSLFEIMIENIHTVIEIRDNTISIMSTLRTPQSDNQLGSIVISEFRRCLKDQYDYVVSRSKMTNNEMRKDLMDRFDFLKKITDYWNNYKDNFIMFEDYISLHSNYIKSKKEFKAEESEVLETGGADIKQALLCKIREIQQAACSQLLA